MLNGRETLDLVVRSQEGPSLTLGAASLDRERMLLVGSLLDPELPVRLDLSIAVVPGPELVDGAHIPREAELALELDGAETRFTWTVGGHDLGDGFALQDARVESEVGPLRVFALEDLALLAGAGLAAAAGVGIMWMKDRREERIRADLDAKWRDCLDRGGEPVLDCAIEDQIGLDPSGMPRVRSGASYRMRCVPPPERG
jgi:hypothetical protein